MPGKHSTTTALASLPMQRQNPDACWSVFIINYVLGSVLSAYIFSHDTWIQFTYQKVRGVKCSVE